MCQSCDAAAADPMLCKRNITSAALSACNSVICILFAIHHINRNALALVVEDYNRSLMPDGSCSLPALCKPQTLLPHRQLQLQDTEAGAQLSVVMGGYPSGRGQTLLLADWLRDQVSACTSPQSTCTEVQLSREFNTAAVEAGNQLNRTPYSGGTANAGIAAADESSVSRGLTTARSAAAAASARSSMPDQKRQEQRKMRQEPDLACSPRGRAGYLQSAGSTWAPHLPSSASQQTLASWLDLLPQEYEGLGLEFWAEEITRGHPDKGKRTLGVLGGGFGLLVHQVAMHCFERGALMAGVSNLYTALMDAEVQSLEEHIQVILDEVTFQKRRQRSWGVWRWLFHVT